MRWLLVALVGCGAAAVTPVPERHDTRPPDPPASTAPVTQIGVGISHSCALHADGLVSCWGDNALRELGVNGGDPRPVPIGVPGVADAVELSVFDHATCARRRSGAVTCWGLVGIEVDGTPTSTTTLPFEPAVQIAGRCVRTSSGSVQCLREHMKVDPISNIVGATDVANMRDWGCAVLAEGKVACWRGTPVALPVPRLARAVQVAVGQGFGCARLHSGQVKCWPMGEPEGDDATAPRAETASARGRVEPHLSARDMVPMAMAIRDARTIVTDDRTVCAIRRAGTVACSAGNEPELQPPGPTSHLAGVTALAVGQHSCAIAEHGVACWGVGINGELGNGWSSIHPLPIAVPDLHDVVELVANTSGDEPRTCVRRSDASAACFGDVVRSTTNPVPVLLEVPHVTAITATELIAVVDDKGAVWNPYLRSPPERISTPPAKLVAYECAATVTGELWCFGNARPASSNDDYGIVPRHVPGVSNVVALAAHPSGGCFVRGDGTAACYRAPKTIVEIPIDDARAIAVGADDDGHTRICLVRANATVACTLDDAGREATLEAPRFAPGLTDVRSLALGTGFGCVARGDGRVLCVGKNTSGQLGDGTTHPRSGPVYAAGITTAIAVTAGAAHACALLRDHTVMCWGSAAHGELGTVATEHVDVPVLVTGLAH